MTTFSAEFKSEMIKKVLSSPDKSVSSIAAESNLNGSTLHRWIKECENSTLPSGGLDSKRPCDWTSEQKFEVLLESSNLNQDELGPFCRKKGLYSHQLESWRAEFMTPKESKLSAELRTELKNLRSENKQLKSELTRKDKALAETAALLILKKKDSLIWGGSEDD